MKRSKIENSNTSSNDRINFYELNPSDDLRTEEMLQNSPRTPLGQLLDKIAQMPEVRYEKVTTVRRQINMGEYQIDEKLDASIDKLLEELIVEL
jgi:anti-sigma28 factor (negative regulator of flagellin synthesis)